jgi:hypothetical protein
MDIQKLANLIQGYSSAHYRDVCAALSALSDELDYTKAALSNDLMAAQNHDDFAKAREVIDMQESISELISKIKDILPVSVEETVNIEEDIERSSSNEYIDYSQYDMDDTVAYDIEDTPVTFKRPAAFSYKGRRYPVTKWKTMLSKLCDLLYKENPEIITGMVNEERQPGVRRVKMSKNKSDIHRPVKISGSDIWLETNRSASDIRVSILVLLDRYREPVDSVKVYFRRDYAALHAEDES